MNELVKFDQVKADMAAFKQVNENIIFDYEDPQGNKDARSHIFKLRKIKTLIADIHKEAKAVAWGVCKLLDKEKKDLTGQVDEWIDLHYKPVKAIEDREAQKAAEIANAARLNAIRVEAERAEDIARREEELADREAAAASKENELARERERLEAAKRAEIDKQAAVKAAQEQAEQDKKDAAELAERDKQAAVEEAEEKARLEREAERERIRKNAEAAQAEKDIQAALEAERVADEKHRARVETEIRQALFALIDDDAAAGVILAALQLDEIPYVIITY